MKIKSIKRTIQNTRRLADLVKTMSKFGFKEVLAESGIDRLQPKIKHETGSEADIRYSNIPKPVRVRMVLEELGPTFIKLGQVLATRPDLIPPEWADEFKTLQGNCSQVGFAEIHEILQGEFPGRLDLLFDSIEPSALAAASIAQVHRARLTSGEEVVIKVLRPGIRQRIEEDMALMETLALFAEQYFSDMGYSPTAVAKEFSREILKEVNLVYEGQATDKLRKYFADDPNIFFPEVFWQATTRNVLTLGEIKGRVLSDISPAELTSAEKRTIVSRSIDAVFKQCLNLGFFHADPHPGNIVIQPDNNICFIDCGMTGQLDKQTAEHLVTLVAGIIKGDIDKICRVIIQLTTADPATVESRDFKTDLLHLISKFRGIELGQIDITALLSEFFGMLQNYRIQCPSDLMLLTKALTVIEGVAEEFAPDFDVFTHVEPAIREMVISRYGYSAIMGRVQKTLAGYLELLENAPHDLQRLLDHARHSRFTLNLEMKRIEHLADKMDHSSRLMGMAMIISALIVASSILILADAITRGNKFLGTLGIFGLLLSAVCSIRFIISFIMPRKKERSR
ncbi:MAG: protein kinase [Deltaproteobacteria bacterium]|nr:MAG: protein kinase [Deltaproteobacteria bacterium]